MKLKKILKIVVSVGAVIFVLIQFVQPERTNPITEQSQTIQASLTVPQEVNNILERACYDCHSNNTKWPFYAYIAPASWLVSHDVTEGREQLNFSEWGKYRQSKQIRKLSAIAGEVTDCAMPMPKYVPLHPEAKLTDTDRKIVSDWATINGKKLMGIEGNDSK